MTSHRRTAGARTPSAPETDKLLEQYGCGPIQFTGTADAHYERHLLFDNVVDPPAVGARERYEAVARSVRDVLSQRWVRTEKTYERLNPKRVSTSPWSSSLAARWPTTQQFVDRTTRWMSQAGSPGPAQRVARRSILSSARSSAAWPERTQPGAGAGSKPNSASSAMRSRSSVAWSAARPPPGTATSNIRRMSKPAGKLP